MKKILAGLLVVILLFNFGLASSGLSQCVASWLIIPISPTFSGMGEVGVCLPSEDIYAGYYNPANGIYGYRGLSFSFSKYKTNWRPSTASDILLNHSVIGINLLPERLPLQITFSRYRTVFDLGEQILMDEYGNELARYNPLCTTDAYSLATRYHGILLKIPVDLSLGTTRKKVVQALIPDEYMDEGLTGTSRNIFYDIGALLSLPFNFYFNDGIGFELVPAGGYSVSNIGDKIFFNDPDKADPSPRYARAGLSLTLNLTYNDDWNLIAYRLARAAGDGLLVPRTDNFDPIRYQAGLGDIDMIRNIVNFESSEDVDISWGQEIAFMDLFSVRLGNYINISGILRERSFGYSLYSTGLFHLLGHATRLNIFDRCADYLNISYNYAKLMDDDYIYDNARNGTKYKSLTFSLNNIDQIFRPDKREKKDYKRTDNPLSIIVGANLSDVRIRDEEIADATHIKVKPGAKFGLESRFGAVIVGAEFDQRGANYKYHLEYDEFPFFYFKIRDTYNYFSFYGLLSYPLLSRLRIFGGLEAGDCISRTSTAELDWGDDSDEDTEDVAPVNLNWDYGLKVGADVMIFRSFGIRAAYYHGMNYIFEHTDIINNCKNRSGELSLIYKL